MADYTNPYTPGSNYLKYGSALGSVLDFPGDVIDAGLDTSRAIGDKFTELGENATLDRKARMYGLSRDEYIARRNENVLSNKLKENTAAAQQAHAQRMQQNPAMAQELEFRNKMQAQAQEQAQEGIVPTNTVAERYNEDITGKQADVNPKAQQAMYKLPDRSAPIDPMFAAPQILPNTGAPKSLVDPAGKPQTIPYRVGETPTTSVRDVARGNVRPGEGVQVSKGPVQYANNHNLAPETMARNKQMYSDAGQIAPPSHPWAGSNNLSADEQFRKDAFDIYDQRANGMKSAVAQNSIINNNREKLRQGVLNVDPTTEYGRQEMRRMGVGDYVPKNRSVSSDNPFGELPVAERGRTDWQDKYKMPSEKNMVEGNWASTPKRDMRPDMHAQRRAELADNKAKHVNNAGKFNYGAQPGGGMGGNYTAQDKTGTTNNPKSLNNPNANKANNDNFNGFFNY